MRNETLAATILSLETALHKKEVRQVVEQLNQLIADDFIEFSASGRKYTKHDIVSRLPELEPPHYEVSNVEVRELADGLAMITYELVEENELGKRLTWRTSLWRQKGESWEMIFHQGTVNE